MGLLRPRDSIRARNAHSSESPSKPRRKPIQPKRSKFRPSPQEMAARLAKRKPVADLGAAAVDALREAHGGIPATALRQIRVGLETANAATCICAIALKEQAADYDTDIALVLQRCVRDILECQMDLIELLLDGRDAPQGLTRRHGGQS